MAESNRQNNESGGTHGMPPLNIPLARLRFQRDGDILRVFDGLRHKWLVLTPEEWVRQNFTSWLISHYGYPASLMQNEASLTLNGTQRRCDTIVFGRDARPLMIVEYKAPDVVINQKVFDQIVRYNLILRARYLVVSNGIRHYCCVMDYAGDTYHFIPLIPSWNEIISPHSEN